MKFLPETLLDRTIGFFSPVAEFKRMRARAAVEMLRGFKGATKNRGDGDWLNGNSSANTDILASLATLRNNSRALRASDPIAGKVISSIVSAVVGTGIRPRMEDPKIWNKFVKQADYDGVLDFYGLQNLAVNSWMESGDVLARIVYSDDPELAVPFQLQVLESDYLDVSRANYNGNIVRGGVEFDKTTGKRVAFWLHDFHPGDVVVSSRNYYSKRVPADEIIHLFKPVRPGQCRGLPALTASIASFHDASQLREIDMMFRKVAACFSVFVTNDDDMPTGSLNGKKDAVTGLREETLSPGMIKYLKSGQDVKTAQPPSLGGIGEILTLTYQLAAAGTNVSYERATGDLSKVNYSSIRAGELNFQAAVQELQWINFMPMFMDRVMAVFDKVGRLKKIPDAQRLVIDYTTPKIGYVDPEKEVAATKEEIKGGLKSHSEALRERGYDPDQVFNELKADREKLKKLGVKVDTDPGFELEMSQAKGQQIDGTGNPKSASAANSKG